MVLQHEEKETNGVLTQAIIGHVGGRLLSDQPVPIVGDPFEIPLGGECGMRQSAGWLMKLKPRFLGGVLEMRERQGSGAGCNWQLLKMEILWFCTIYGGVKK